jgi:N-acetylmuramoyl-L-alanine amidase
VGYGYQFSSRKIVIFSAALAWIILGGATLRTPTEAAARETPQMASQQQTTTQQNTPQSSAPAQQPSTVFPSAQQPAGTTPGTAPQYPAPAVAGSGLNIVVLDPAHGGTDPGARGTGGIRESDLVLELADQVRRSLEAQGFQVLQTRSGNDDPSLDDRSAMANAQTGAVFISLHIASTGLPGTVRTYVMTDMPLTPDPSGLILWNQAQAPYLQLSHLLGDAVQQQLALIFHGSPNNALTASVRQLRTTAAPAIAVELSSVAVQDPADLEHMMPGVADAIARGVVAFRPLYVTPRQPTAPPGAQP